jgi:hypothetical protein
VYRKLGHQTMHQRGELLLLAWLVVVYTTLMLLHQAGAAAEVHQLAMLAAGSIMCTELP